MLSPDGRGRVTVFKKQRAETKEKLTEDYIKKYSL